jgi:polar amino acid transport system permease protein
MSFHLGDKTTRWSTGHERLVTVAMAVAFVAVAGLLLWVIVQSGGSTSASTYAWDFGVVQRYWPALWAGLKITAAIAVVSITAGILLGIPVALMQLSRVALVRWIVTVYVEIMRCTPMLVLLVWFYYALPIVTGITLPAFQAVILAFTLNSAAFYGEALPQGQVEAATILGLSYSQRMRYVIVPQGFRNVLPVLVSISVQLFKDTSLVAIIGVADLMYNGQLASSNSYRPLEILTTLAVIYFVILFPITLALRQLETRLGRHRR